MNKRKYECRGCLYFLGDCEEPAQASGVCELRRIARTRYASDIACNLYRPARGIKINRNKENKSK